MSHPNVRALSPLQAARRAVLFGAVGVVFVLFAVTAAWRNKPLAHEGIEVLGLIAILACIAGRCWCTLYIGGRKGRELVAVGPYSLCRNPLYTFSIIGAFGFGAQTGSVTIGLVCAMATWAVFRFVVSREERFLAGELGQPYADYLSTTPRFLPSPAGWRNVEAIEVRPGRVAATFLDGLVFLLAIPIAEGLEGLQGHAWLPVLLSLP